MIRALAAAAALLASAAGCQGESNACAADRDCPAGFHCVAGTGVCLRQSLPELDLAVVDAPLDLAPADALPDGGTD